MFVKKLYKIVRDPLTNHIVSWTPAKNGVQSFTIHCASMFKVEVLPTHFKHGSMHSFLRQLNKYQFKKQNKGETDRLIFSHLNFKDGNEDDLANI